MEPDAPFERSWREENHVSPPCVGSILIGVRGVSDGVVKQSEGRGVLGARGQRGEAA